MLPVQSAPQVDQKATFGRPVDRHRPPVAQPPRVESKVSGCTAQHRGDRREQQDRVALLSSALAPRCALGVLADGMGGRSGGVLAADNVVSATSRRFQIFHPDAQSPQRFFESLVDEGRARAGGRGDNCSLLLLKLSS